MSNAASRLERHLWIDKAIASIDYVMLAENRIYIGYYMSDSQRDIDRLSCGLAEVLESQSNDVTSEIDRLLGPGSRVKGYSLSSIKMIESPKRIAAVEFQFVEEGSTIRRIASLPDYRARDELISTLSQLLGSRPYCRTVPRRILYYRIGVGVLIAAGAMCASVFALRAGWFRNVLCCTVLGIFGVFVLSALNTWSDEVVVIEPIDRALAPEPPR